jgi:hypothetical protein
MTCPEMPQNLVLTAAFAACSARVRGERLMRSHRCLSEVRMTGISRKEALVPTMIVLVNLKEGVDPEDYERWILDSYAPAVRDLLSVANWRDYRTTGLPASDAAPPYQYVVTLDVNDMEQLGRDMAGEEMQRLFSELHDLADIIQIMAERFA